MPKSTMTSQHEEKMVSEPLEPRLHDIDTDCYLIRNHLRPEEQVVLFQYIQKQDQTPWDTLPRVMVPVPKTLLFKNDKNDENEPTLNFEPGDKSVISGMVGKANAIMNQSNSSLDLRKYKSLSMAAIRYKSPDGRFPPHLDHCNNSFVYLMSLGCTANFMVKGPNMEDKRDIKFHSGDLMVFNASTEAAILHGVMSIEPGTCPEALGKAFPVLQNHRYGVQCRARF